MRNDKTKRDFLDLGDGEFPTDSMTRRATAFLRSRHEQPFFLMVSHFFVHTPVHTRIRWLRDHYRAKIPASHPRHAAFARYGAMVTTFDHLVGQLLTTLEDAGLAQSTLIVFTSDNGGHPEYAGNAPLRGSKWNLYEGGIRVPFLVRWPGKTEPATVSDAVVTGVDLLPTFAEIGGATVPPDLDGRSFVPLFRKRPVGGDSRKFIWHFPYYHPEKGFAKAPAAIGVDDGLTSQTRPHSVLRSGSWKLIHFYEDDRDELYRVPADVAEEQDQSELEAEVAARLRKELQATLEAAARLPAAQPDWP